MGKYTFNLPDIGEGIAEAEIVEWHVKVGDTVEEDQGIADMMTDKATVEMEAPVSGKIVEVAGEAGDVVSIGSMLVVIETGGDVDEEELDAKVEASAADDAGGDAPAHRGTGEAADAGPGMDEPEMAAETPGVEDREPDTPRTEVSPKAEEGDAAPKAADKKASGPVLASPAVRKRAKELGIDLADVTAREGDRVRHSDLDAFLTYGAGQGYRPPGSAKRADEEVKVIGLRRRIAQNMAESKRHIPHFSYVEEMDVTALEEMRADLNENRGDKPKLTVLPFFIAAICRAIPEFPMVNATFDDEAGVVTRHGAVHMGIATQTDSGLMVPVIRDAQDKNVWQLAREISRLADAARTGKAKSEELSGSTLTVTSLGPLGGIATTPVINRPEVAIIGPNKIVERPVIAGGELEARLLMNMSISCDHRVVDGYDAASFMQHLKHLIETPVLLFSD